MKKIILPVLLGTALCAYLRATPVNTDSIPLYNEEYRPRYHFTPAHRWIGDPCGLIKTDSVYHLYYWGAASGKDLVHWKEINNHAINNVPKGIACFTGSVVADKEGSAGFGKDALVAVFTSFDEESKKQSQSIAFSLDGGNTFQYYDRNPVLDIWSTEFRDPTVIWDDRHKRWVMFVAKALEKKIGIYVSPNLKDWEWKSDFGPLGDTEKSWECPDVFQVEVEGEPGVRKWVMVVSVNWAREQYFIGDFDGESFIAEEPAQYPLYVDEGLDYYASRVFQTPDEKDAAPVTLGWVNTWDYANPAPSKWGKGIWSVPREYKLRRTAEGLRLYQNPVENLKMLRGKPIGISKILSAGVTPLRQIGKLGNAYELVVDFTNLGTHPFGLNLCEGEGRRLVLSYDPSSHYLSVDRTNVAKEEIPKFERKAHVKVLPQDGKLKLHVFVDKSTVEVFANDGEKTLTMLTFAAEGQDVASLFSLGQGVKARITAYPLKSIWK